tara:strand:- start:95 stop:523 length:429 start_codon:yes stop_codon:yes gene_type:complete
MTRFYITTLVFLLTGCYYGGTHGKMFSFEFKEGKENIESKLLSLNKEMGYKVKKLPNYGGIERSGYLSCRVGNVKGGNDLVYTLHFYGGEEYYKTHPNSSVLSVIGIDEITPRDSVGVKNFDSSELKEVFSKKVILKIKNMK